VSPSSGKTKYKGSTSTCYGNPFQPHVGKKKYDLVNRNKKEMVTCDGTQRKISYAT